VNKTVNLFEFLMVLVSIIVGLGLAELLTGVARLLRARGTTRYYWVHGVLTTTIFVALLQQWWEAWGLRAVPQWSFLALVLMLAGPTCLFLISHLLFPEVTPEVDVEEYYYGPMRPVWALGILAIVGSTSFRPIMFGDALLALDNATSFLGIIVFAGLLVSSRRPVHATLLPVVLASLLYDVLRWSPVISQ
jgi:hypothetical protein